MTKLPDSSSSSTPLEYIDSHYSRQLPKEDPRPPLLGLLHTDVVIIGGGLAGLSAAASLIERGHRDIVILEARRVGWGASSRNAGHVSSGFVLDPWDIEARVGREQGRRLFKLSRDAVALLRARIDRQALPCDKRQCGGVKAFWTPDLDEAKRQQDFMQEVLGEPCELWSTERTRAVLRTQRYHQALYSAEVFCLQPLHYVRALAMRIAQAGARIYEGTAVRGIAIEQGRAIVRMQHGEVRARHALVCCGGDGGLVPQVARALVPVYAHLIATAPLGERLTDVMRVPHGVCDSRIDHDYYSALPDGRLMFGGGVSIGPLSPERVTRRLRRRLLAVYPQLAKTLRVDSAWSGRIELTRHLMPLFGQTHGGIWYSAGHGGQGLTTTSLHGELFARAVVERDDTYRLFAPFSPEWTGGPLRHAAAQLSYWYYQGCDRLRDWRSRSRAALPLP